MTIADLRALEAQMTERPWHASETGNIYSASRQHVAEAGCDGAGLAALRNAAPELLAVAEAAQAAREVMKDRSERDEQGRVVIRPQRWEEAWQVFDAALAALDARLRETP